MKKRKKLLNSLEYKYGKYAVNNLMLIVVGAMAIVFVMDLLISSASGISIYSLLMFNRSAIFRGEVWRILTFAFLPPNDSLIFIIFSLYFYYMIGTALEREWGAFRFNLFYIAGIIGTIISGLIMGFADNYFLNMSLFLAFAILYPNFQILLFFILPVKMKYLAYLDLALFAYMFIVNSWSVRLCIIVSLINLILFFWDDFLNEIKRIFMNIKFMMNRNKNR